MGNFSRSEDRSESTSAIRVARLLISDTHRRRPLGTRAHSHTGGCGDGVVTLNDHRTTGPSYGRKQKKRACV